MEWISVDDRLPPTQTEEEYHPAHRVYVLFCAPSRTLLGNGVSVGSWEPNSTEDDGGIWLGLDEEVNADEVTHWMSLPDSPLT